MNAQIDALKSQADDLKADELKAQLRYVLSQLRDGQYNRAPSHSSTGMYAARIGLPLVNEWAADYKPHARQDVAALQEAVQVVALQAMAEPYEIYGARFYEQGQREHQARLAEYAANEKLGRSVKGVGGHVLAFVGKVLQDIASQSVTAALRA